tara:strand:- start:135 stop:773 length:639 start_codon:yes stop_codon:yes gene_type:complete
MDTIHSKLVAIQSGLKAPKNQKNNFAGYTYRSCEDILEAVKPLLKEHNLILLLADNIVEVGGRVYVKATASISAGTLQPNGLDAVCISVNAFAREQEKKVNKSGAETMDHAQLTGSASSYARKYALNGLFLIDDTKDSDTMDNTAPKVAKPVEPTAPVKPTIEQVIKAISEANTEVRVEKLHDNAIKYVWTADEKKMIEETKNHRLDVLLLA